jgi:myo-inositol-hexaphosphate 3-phosphohydrolase
MVVSRTRLAVVAVLLAVVGLVGVPSTASAAPGDIGFQGQSFTGVVNPPTSDRPQSELWHADGQWWAHLFDSDSRDWHIFRLDRTSGGSEWVDTGVLSDPRTNVAADVLWDGSKLYIASHVVKPAGNASATNNPARLYRYSYSPATQTYTLDSGFPTQINDVSSESLTIDKDTRGTLWATWTQVAGAGTTATATVYLNSLASGSATWGAPFVVPTTGGVVPAADSDDISALVAFQNKIGVLWSNQRDGTVYWSVHDDGAPRTTWAGGRAARGNGEADDHLNLKSIQSDSLGRVFAVVKTSLDRVTSSPRATQVRLLVFRPATGDWSSTVVSTVADCHTRPQLLLDETNQRVHVIATGPTGDGTCTASGAGSVYLKSAPMDTLRFSAGVGTPIIRDAASDSLNNITTTKQPVSDATGLVVLASNSVTSRYWHADIPLGQDGARPPTGAVPTADFTPPASAVAGSVMSFTDTSTGSPTSWAWAFGDGASSTERNPSHTYPAAGTYTVTLTASNASGSSAPVSKQVTVTEAAASVVAEAPAGAGSVPATVETQPVGHSGDAADDAAVWVSPVDPAQSAVVATDKQGGLYVYDLAGQPLQYLPVGNVNNVDVRSAADARAFVLGGRAISLVVVGNRSNNSIGLFALNAGTRQLEDVSARTIQPGIPAYGSCLYRSAGTGTFYVFVTSKTGQVEQWELSDNGAGRIDAGLVRAFQLGSQLEGCVADDELGHLYVGEETVGIWKFGAEPAAGATGTLIAATSSSGPLVPQVEGLAIAHGPGGTGYLIASSQGSDSYVVYTRAGDNSFVRSFTVASNGGVDGTQDTDGIDVVTANLGPAFPSGLFVAQDGVNEGGNQNFKLVAYQEITALLP